MGDSLISGESYLAPPIISEARKKATPIAAASDWAPSLTAREQPRQRDAPSTQFSPEILACAIGASDFFLVLVAGAGAFAAHYDVVAEAGARHHLLIAFLAGSLFVSGYERIGGYRLKQLSELKWQLTRIPMIWGILVAVLLLLAFITKTSETFSRGWVLACIGAAMGMQMAGRRLSHIAMQRRPHGSHLARNIVIFGGGGEGQQLVTKLRQSPDKSIVLRGVFDDRKSRTPRTFNGVDVLGTSDDLLRFARKVRVDVVIIALPLDAERRLQMLFQKLKGVALDLRLSVEPIAEKFQVRGVSYIGAVPVLDIADRPLKQWRTMVKWIEDKSLAILLLIGFAPLMGLVALLIKLESRGPVLFVQKRFGFNNEVIRVLKFRTMYINRSDRSGTQRTVRNDPRVTRVGRVIRALSIDELPQLINVLRGEMSIVGPRPHPVAMQVGDGALYGDAIAHYCHRHRVKPGITGWAQVNGLRGEVDALHKARARVDHDLYYIEHWSPWLDLKILVRTIVVIIYQPAY
jgi:Undecaprenyl-phosphate glucose phosphotransferase